jgi:hypothetical protein
MASVAMRGSACSGCYSAAVAMSRGPSLEVRWHTTTSALAS